jgi:hypothetical protein
LKSLSLRQTYVGQLRKAASDNLLMLRSNEEENFREEMMLFKLSFKFSEHCTPHWIITKRDSLHMISPCICKQPGTK